jgi:hypothetical protein
MAFLCWHVITRWRTLSFHEAQEGRGYAPTVKPIGGE